MRFLCPSEEALSLTLTNMYTHRYIQHYIDDSHHWESITNNLTIQLPLWLVSTIASRLFQHTGITSDLELSTLPVYLCPSGTFQAVGSGPDFWNGSNWALWDSLAGSFHLPWQINGRSHHRAGGQGLAQPVNRIPMSLLTQHRQRLVWGRIVGQRFIVLFWFLRISRTVKIP